MSFVYPNNTSLYNTKDINPSSIKTFTSLNQVNRDYRHMCCNDKGDVYVTVYGGFIYRLVNGVGNLVVAETNPVSRNWIGICSIGNDVYATVFGGLLYKQVNGEGNFIQIGPNSNRNYTGITGYIESNGDKILYVCVQSFGVYRIVNESVFTLVTFSTASYNGVTKSGNAIYVSVSNGTWRKHIPPNSNFTILSGNTVQWRQIQAFGRHIYGCVTSTTNRVTIQLDAELGLFTSVSNSAINNVSNPYVGICMRNNVVYVSSEGGGGQIYTFQLNEVASSTTLNTNAFQQFKTYTFSDILTIEEGNNRYARLNVNRTNDGAVINSGCKPVINSNINVNGYLTYPTRPSWCVYKVSHIVNTAPSNVTYNTRICLDVGCSVNLGTGVLTIQTTGRYAIFFNGFTENSNLATTNEIFLRKNGVDITRNYTQDPGGAYYNGLDIITLVDCAVGDTLYIYINSGAVHQNENCCWSGFLI